MYKAVPELRFVRLHDLEKFWDIALHMMMFRMDNKLAVAAGTTLVALAGAAFILRRAKEKKLKAAAAEEAAKRRLVSLEVDKQYLVKSVNATDAGQRWTLSEVDEMTTVTWIRFAFRVESNLDPDKVRKGLERVLAELPFVAARLDKEYDSLRYSLWLDNADSNGVYFEVVRGTWKDSHVKLPDVNSSSTAWSQAGIFLPAKGAAPSPNEPLLKARLIQFEDRNVSYLSIILNHCLGDAQTYVEFMQRWSDACNSEVDPSTLKPLVLPPRVNKPIDETPKTRKELLQKWRDEIGGTPPLATRWFWWNLIFNMVWSSYTCEVVEVFIDKQGLERLKDSVSAMLPQGEWVSTYEVAMSSILCAQRAATAGPRAKDTRPVVQAINTRGRLARYPKNYVGNAVFDVPLQIEIDPASLASSALSLHRAIRAELSQDGENLAKRKNWLEHARALGMRKETGVFHIVGDCARGKQTFLNTWAGYQWLVNMGAPADKGASAYMVPPPVQLPGLNILLPRSNQGDLGIFLVMPKCNVKAFWDYVTATRLPFHKPAET